MFTGLMNIDVNQMCNLLLQGYKLFHNLIIYLSVETTSSQDSTIKCNCGTKDNVEKRSTKQYCNKNYCECKRNSVPCGPSCCCVQCHNDLGTRSQNCVKMKPCRCTSGCIKRCTCSKMGFSCSEFPSCKCIGCKNTNGISANVANESNLEKVLPLQCSPLKRPPILQHYFGR